MKNNFVNDSVSPYNFKSVLGYFNPQFKKLEANDSKDLILYLLQIMHEELNYFGDNNSMFNSQPNQYDRALTFNFFMNNYNSHNFSIISNLFYGTYETITKCDEGIEGAIIKVYSGTIIITSTDDGINVQNSFYGTDSYDSTAEISMNFYGGNVYVNAEGDGLDANGDINIYGGSLQVWGMAAGGDNEPVDHDDNLIINNTTLIAGGSKGTSYTHNGITSTNQYSIYTTESITSGTTVYVKDEENNTVETIAVPKNIDYLFYSSKSVTSSFYFATSSGNISTTYFDGNSQNQEGPNGDRPSGPGEQGDGPGQNNTNNTNVSSSNKSDVSSSESDVSSSESDVSSSESDDSSKGNYIYFSMILNILIFICIHI
jgi:hypothetical protein